MLKIIWDLHELDFSQLMLVYEEGNRENGAELYPNLTETEQLLSAEQDFYAYLNCFFRTEHAFYAVWEENGLYLAALRMEPYRDGLLLEALETRPDQRRKGLATLLMKETFRWLQLRGNVKVYSHIHKKNTASVAAHLSCGFQCVLDYAAYVDGSVLHNSYTFLKEI